MFDSLEPQDESVQEAWDKEVARRMSDLKAGRATTIPWEELHRQLLAMVNEPSRVEYQSLEGAPLKLRLGGSFRNS